MEHIEKRHRMPIEISRCVQSREIITLVAMAPKLPQPGREPWQRCWLDIEWAISFKHPFQCLLRKSRRRYGPQKGWYNPPRISGRGTVSKVALLDDRDSGSHSLKLISRQQPDQSPPMTTTCLAVCPPLVTSSGSFRLYVFVAVQIQRPPRAWVDAHLQATHASTLTA